MKTDTEYLDTTNIRVPLVTPHGLVGTKSMSNRARAVRRKNQRIHRNGRYKLLIRLTTFRTTKTGIVIPQPEPKST